MKFYSVKYWATVGIEEIEMEVTEDGKYARTSGAGYHRFEKIGRDCFTYKKHALDQANLLRMRKIASLRKQLAKVEALRFS